MPSDDYYRRRYIWDLQLADLEGWDALGVLADEGQKLLAGLRQQAAYFEGRDMDDATRQIRQDFESFLSRGPEIRATIQGNGAWLWLRSQGFPPVPDFGANLKLWSASMDAEGGRLEFVTLRDAREEVTVPTEALRDLLTALQELPDAARLLVGSEITLSFRPGT